MLDYQPYVYCYSCIAPCHVDLCVFCGILHAFIGSLCVCVCAFHFQQSMTLLLHTRHHSRPLLWNLLFFRLLISWDLVIGILITSNMDNHPSASLSSLPTVNALLTAAGASQQQQQQQRRRRRRDPIRQLPKKLLIGYGVHSDRVRQAVHDGVNVVIWAFMDIVAVNHNNTNDDVDVDDNSVVGGECSDDVKKNANDVGTTGTASSTKRTLQSPDIICNPQQQKQRRTEIVTNLDLKKVAALIQELDETGFSDVVHLVSCGGWNGPHLDTTLSAEEWYQGWIDSSLSTVFHGIDWDLEGNDDLNSPYNIFTVECLEKMGTISKSMKHDGYIVAMAPPQSYMNFDNPHFSRYVNLTEPERPWHPDFHYFGANVYSFLLAKYGNAIDFVSMQLYESWSLAAMAVYHDNQAPEDYLVAYIRDLLLQRQSQFYVDFGQDLDLGLESQYVSLPPSKLVIGLANGWAADPDNSKTVYISPDQVRIAYEQLQNSGKDGDLTPRGFMFWTIEEEGTRDVYLARDISAFLKNR